MDAATFQIVANIIQTVGFPVAVSVYVLWRLDGLIRNVLSTVNETLGLLKQQAESSQTRTEDVKKLQDRIEDLQDKTQELVIRLSVKGTEK